MVEREVPVAGAVSEIVVVSEPRKLWPALAVRGVLSLVFGILTLLWPHITVLALALLFGAWALLDGVSFLATAFRAGRAGANWRGWVPPLLGGLLGIAAAVVTVFWPAITVLALAVVVAVLLIGVGVVEIMLAARLRAVIRGEMVLAIAGLAAVLAGVAILVWPAPGIIALTMTLGAYAVVAGVLLIVAAFRVRALVARHGEDR